PDARPGEVHNEIFDLFALLDASEAQLDFPTLFASGRDGWAVADLGAPHRDLAPLFDLVVAHVPRPEAGEDAPFAVLATTLDADPVNDLLGQRQPAGRPRRRQGHVARHRRAALSRSRGQRRDQGARKRRAGFGGGRRPRRVAAWRIDRDDAPRGFRIVDLAAAG